MSLVALHKYAQGIIPENDLCNAGEILFEILYVQNYALSSV